MFQFSPPDTLVEVGFNGGRPDKPFVRQTLAQGNSLPAIKPGEQLQQQRDGVSQRVTVAGDWERQTDQTIRESSMRREITADEETRKVVARETTVQATDKTTVLCKASLLAGAIQQISQGDYSLAGVRQEVIAPVVWIGSQSINVCQLMLDTLDVVKQLAELTASHTHNNTGGPLNASAINATGNSASGLKAKYDPVIG